MKTRPRSISLLAGAGVLLLIMTLAWLRVLPGASPASAAPAVPAALTLRQSAAIHGAEDLLLFGTQAYMVYLPLVTH